ncbi:hypothetical protein HAX54_000362 [Datura stramonium]|uniref:Uncharacterized protein n=1 Tax=Datura stramonium TaxID=4076 RepID=A0ABS8WS37_DATST|nr:hypothetical protein [Datura stramonium]
MLRRWRKKAAMTACGRVPADVPSRHVAVTVGMDCKRSRGSMTYLNHPLFQKLLARAEEEYGFSNSAHIDPLRRGIVRGDTLLPGSAPIPDKNNVGCFINFEDFQRYCHVESLSNSLPYRSNAFEEVEETL